MNNLDFKNRPNEEVELVDGRKVWLSRSPAVVGVVFALIGDDIFVLTEKRSSIMDEPNKWAVVSGYLDWDENGFEGIRREIYEETGFLLDDYEDNLVFDNDRQPFYVHTDPTTDAKQNVSLSYIFAYQLDYLPTSIETFMDKEISEVKWMNFLDINKGDKQWAFDHNKRIVSAAEYLSKNL